ncbi:MAG: AAA family ATPase [bacterium]|nr:AAA family ATPase [bacterium]
MKHFRCYNSEVEIPMSDLTAFIGKNDSGKSTVLEALEIFLNNSLVSCEKADLNNKADNNNIEISCVFSDYPKELIIDSSSSTNLTKEFLTNTNNMLEIKKIFPTTANKPKEKTYIICNHPSIKHGNDLLTLKQTDLKKGAEQLNISKENYNANINSSIRSAIWDSFENLNLSQTELLVDKEDTKKVYESLKKYLPIYALFQSDRPSQDDDKEVTDPMKIAIQEALADLESEIEIIKKEVKKKAIETANRTLTKLKEMSPEIADELIPEFKTEPKFESQFKLTINSDEGIPINKRGSGIRRLILLNFFRAEAEKRKSKNNSSSIIFAFEEPETSQHPNHQEMLINTFIELSNSNNSQILLTTHTPALAGLLPLESLRFICKKGSDRIIEIGTDEVFKKIANTLGVLANPINKNAKALLLIEGKNDVTFINHTAEMLKNSGFITHTFKDKNIALVPIGGCGNLKHWITLHLAEQFAIPHCVLLDSDKGTAEEEKNKFKIAELRQKNIKAYLTRKREPENYIDNNCLNLPKETSISYSDTCDAKIIIANKTRTRKQKVLENFWTKMTCEQIRNSEKYFKNGEEKYEFTEMFQDFLSLV